MPPLSFDYRDFDACLALVKELLELGEEDRLDRVLSLMLEDSAGFRSDLGVMTTYYRPYWVTAKAFERDSSKQSFSSAGGAAFTGYKTPIQSFLDQQLALDRKLGLTVPSGFAAMAVLNLPFQASQGVPTHVTF